MSKEKYIIQPSAEMQDGWVATDTENDTVRCTSLLTDGREPTAIELTTAIRELADWLRKNHYNRIF